jgi:hypothetical protein
VAKYRKTPGKPARDRPKGYSGPPTDPFKIGRGAKPTYSGLGPRYRKLYRDMVAKKIPKSVALEKANNLRLAQNRYHAGKMSKDDFGQWFEEQFYDDLYYDYSYDVDEHDSDEM